MPEANDNATPTEAPDAKPKPQEHKVKSETLTFNGRRLKQGDSLTCTASMAKRLKDKKAIEGGRP